MSEPTRRCSACDEEKPESAFPQNKNRYKCKECHNAYLRDWYRKKNPKTEKTSKQCWICKTEKPLTEFYRSRERYQTACKVCQADRQREESRKNPDKVKARRAAARQRAKERDPDYHRRWKVEKQFGLSWDEYQELMKQQQGVCAICRRPERRVQRTLAVDHDHGTGEVRGLLCGDCNTALGLFGDDIERLLVAVEYLRTSRK